MFRIFRRLGKENKSIEHETYVNKIRSGQVFQSFGVDGSCNKKKEKIWRRLLQRYWANWV